MIHLPAVFVCVDFYAQGVDGGIQDHPGAPPELRTEWDIDQDRLFVLPEAIHDVGPKLQHLVIHVWKAKQPLGEATLGSSTQLHGKPTPFIVLGVLREHV